MKKILALSGSNSKNSINKLLLRSIARRFDHHEVKYVDLNNYRIPIYGIDLEEDRGIPVDIQVIGNIIAEHEGLIISVNEHNGTISAFFKNIIDWLSRLDRGFLKDKKILVVSTSPGKTGASRALDYIKETLPWFGAAVIDGFSFPNFHDNFDAENIQIMDEVLELGVNDVVSNFEHQLTD